MKIEAFIEFADKHEWTGYLWKDDAQEPELFEEATSIKWKDHLIDLPFVLEGNFIDAKQKIALSIKNDRGTYELLSYTCLPNETCYEIPLSKGKEKDKINALWLPYFKTVNDPFEEGFEEQYFSQYLFMGFKEKEDKK
jgi:CRISPR type III-associated protein (TIGR04423 family)